MSITQQYLIDAYRAAQHSAPQPPAPGHNAWQTVRALRDYRRFQAITHERPTHGRGRLSLSRFISRFQSAGRAAR